jgi:hypothetical protein
MKQTAVDWLEDNLIGNPFSEKDFAHNVNIFKQAKEIEKEQMGDTWVDSRTFDKGDNYFGKQKSFDEYYNETYK